MKCYYLNELSLISINKLEGETVDSFITDLYTLSEHCAYGDLFWIDSRTPVSHSTIISANFLFHFHFWVNLDTSRIKPDPEKVHAITQMTAPQNVSELRRFLGMTNQLNKFLPDITRKTKPLNDLLGKNLEWTWGSSQEISFQVALSSSCTLGCYNPNHDTVIATDASSYGLGAVLYQREPRGNWKPITYAPGPWLRKSSNMLR